ncbi:MAG TPA: hypothetical protein VE987_12370 [Polyangiaceae bacterium]|nr:hypothetical protein [Polyangiaceae bacterium]
MAMACAACAHEDRPPASGAPRSGDERAADVVNATILTNGCEALGRTNARLAERAMYELVEGCTSVPGGSAQFGATLLPGGRIEIAAAAGQPGVVPICVLKHPLTHKVPLERPCRLDVHIAESSVRVR